MLVAKLVLAFAAINLLFLFTELAVNVLGTAF
jgi:hypothetical protein